MSTIETKKKKTLTKKTKKTKAIKEVWTIEHQKLQKRLYNHYKKTKPEAEMDTYINLYKNKLSEFIRSLNQSISSEKAFYFMVARWLQINKPEDRYIRIYQELGYGKMKDNGASEGKQEQSKRELVYYRPLSYFANILQEKVDELETDPYLLLMMLTLQPAVRASFYNTASFITQEKQNNKIDNFILINKKTKKIFYIVNNDKVKNGKQYTINKNTHIEIESTILKNQIRISYDMNPRTYLFENDGEPYAYSTLLRWLHKITGLNGTSINMFRSAHVNQLYHNPKATTIDKKKLALQMRHSPGAAEEFYKKILLSDDEGDEEEEEEKESCDEVRSELKAIKSKIHEEADQAILDKKFKKKRYDVVRNLNVKGIQPLKSSILTYTLTQDENGKWL
jgi:hypothetical protein